MKTEQLNLLLDKLIDKTQKDELDRENSDKRDTFQVKLKNNVISIGDILGGGFIIYLLKEGDNNYLEIIDDAMLSPLEAEFDKTKKLFQEIEKTANSESDEAIDQILEQLAA